jgi:Na+/proline symporter
MVTYFAVGGGKFVTEFIIILPYIGLPSEFWAALFLMIIVLCYTITTGYTAVVYTDV